MKTYSNFREEITMLEGVVDDVLNMGSKFLYRWKEKWIFNTHHGFDRIKERSKLTIDELKKLFRNAIEKVKDFRGNVGKNILFYSKSLNQGFVSAVEPTGLSLITFLPPGKSFAKSGTDKMVIEGVEELGEDFVIDIYEEID